MKNLRLIVLIALAAAMFTAVSGCAIPRAIGKTAGGVVKTAGKVVAGTAKAVTAPLR